MRQNWLCGIILTLSAGACNPTSEPDIAPLGTVQSAQRLILGFSGGIQNRSTVSTQVCLNNTGACGTHAGQAELAAEALVTDGMVGNRRPVRLVHDDRVVVMVREDVATRYRPGRQLH